MHILKELFSKLMILEENFTDCRFLALKKQLALIFAIELLDKSMSPERFVQYSNALFPSTDNDIGAKVSNPVIGVEGILAGAPQFLKVFEPIDVSLEEKDATSLWQFTNADAPMVVNGIALIFVMVVMFEQSLNASLPIVASRLVEFRDTPMRFVRF
jgi:hypothetical protein